MNLCKSGHFVNLFKQDETYSSRKCLSYVGLLIFKHPCLKYALWQTAGISFRAFYKLGTEPLPLGLEMLIRKSHFLEQPIIELPWRLDLIRQLSDWLRVLLSPWRSERSVFPVPQNNFFVKLSRNLWP